MSSNQQPPNMLYPVANGLASSNPFVVAFKDRDPTTADINYPIQKWWFNTTTKQLFILKDYSSTNATLTANWIQIPGGGTALIEFTGGTGTSGTFPVNPNAFGQIELLSSDGSVEITGGLNSLDFETNGSIVIESFTVDAVTAPGTNPVTPNAGLVNVGGAVVTAHNVPVETRTRALHTYKVEVQYASAVAATDGTKVGLAAFDSAHFSVDTSGFVTANFSTTDLHWPTVIVGDTANGANYATIAAAVAATSSGDTICIQPGTYTENLALTTPRRFVGIGPAENQTIIVGKISDSGNSMSIVFQNIHLRTNNDYVVEITGVSSFVTLWNCYLDVTNHTALNVTQASGTMQLKNCTGAIATTGITWYAGSGVYQFFWSYFTNGGLSTTASSSAGSVTFSYTTFPSPISATAASSVICFNSNIDTSAINTVAITTSGTGTSQIYNSDLQSGSASALSIGSGTIVFAANNVVRSSATNVFTGAGTINTGGNVCTSSSGNNVSTINNLTTI